MKELKLLNHLIENIVKITNKSFNDVQNEIFDQVETDFETRGKMLDILLTIQENLSCAPIAENSSIIVQFSNQLNQVVEEIKVIDSKILEI